MKSGAIFAALLLTLLVPRAFATTCTGMTVGLDTTFANDLDGPILGEAYEQVFDAPESLLTAITVWRIASEDTNYAGWHIFIMKADSAGTPLTKEMILDGP